jgi:hypothetical protein
MIKHKHESAVLSYTNSDGLNARQEIFDLMNNYAATDEEKERSLGLFLRGSLLARILAITEIYQTIVDLPGAILDIGTWRGQTAVLCENLRAIYEPLNFNRRIICFDTFEGYQGFSEKDKATSLHRNGTYTVGGSNYAHFLTHLLTLHEKSNAMGHNHGKHRVIAGDCRQTIPKYFSDQPHEFLSLAFFDINSYDVTMQAFNDVWPRLTPGGIAAFWQLSRDNVTAEGRVYAEHILKISNHSVHKSKIYPGLCYLIKIN